MEEVKILELTERCIKYFQEHNYTESRISRYKSLWRNGIIHYMSQRGIESYSPAVGADFVQTCHFNGTIRPQEREKIRSVQALDDLMKLGCVRKRSLPPVSHALDGEIGADMEKLPSARTAQLTAAERVHIREGTVCRGHARDGIQCNKGDCHSLGRRHIIETPRPALPAPLPRQRHA